MYAMTFYYDDANYHNSNNDSRFYLLGDAFDLSICNI